MAALKEFINQGLATKKQRELYYLIRHYYQSKEVRRSAMRIKIRFDKGEQMEEDKCSERCLFCKEYRTLQITYYSCENIDGDHYCHMFTKEHTLCKEAINNPDMYLKQL